MEIYNYMEDLVDALLPNLLKKYEDVCTCSQCIADIKALALNNLPPKYVSTEKGSVYSKANMFTIQSETDITKAIIGAIEKVVQSPRHGT